MGKKKGRGKRRKSSLTLGINPVGQVKNADQKRGSITDDTTSDGEDDGVETSPSTSTTLGSEKTQDHTTLLQTSQPISLPQFLFNEQGKEGENGGIAKKDESHEFHRLNETIEENENENENEKEKEQKEKEEKEKEQREREREQKEREEKEREQKEKEEKEREQKEKEKEEKERELKEKEEIEKEEKKSQNQEFKETIHSRSQEVQEKQRYKEYEEDLILFEEIRELDGNRDSGEDGNIQSEDTRARQYERTSSGELRRYLNQFLGQPFDQSQSPIFSWQYPI